MKSAKLHNLLRFIPKTQIAPPNPQFPKYSGAKDHSTSCRPFVSRHPLESLKRLKRLVQQVEDHRPQELVAH
jgi:hypothetical protein